MNILAKARKLESRISHTVERVARQWSQSGQREPLEIFHAIVDAVHDRVEPAGRGRHVFPFNRIDVTVAAASREARARFEAIFDGDPSLQQAMAARLRDAGCEADGLHIRTTYVDEPESDWDRPEFHLVFERRTGVALPTPSERPLPELSLAIISGAAAEPSYTLAVPHLAIGRGAEVRDSQNRLLRTNHVVFGDGDDDAVAQTVSRRHAHIEYEAAAGEYRIVDDLSAHGTSLVRSGRTIPVPAGTRGIRLRDGDEIVLGEARIRVAIEAG